MALTKITENVIKDSFKTAISGSDTSEMTLATASIAAITASVSTLKSNVGQELNTDSAVTFATVDTGQGANELYDMDQNVLTTSSPTFAGVTATGTITAQEFQTQFVSASIIYQSGSTKFGDTTDDIHQFTGSLAVTGSNLTITTGGNVSGSATSTGSFGSAHIMGNVNIGNTVANPSASAVLGSSDTSFTISGSIFPEGDAKHDLGSANYQWKNIYTSDFHLNNTSKTEGNSVDGTKGSWTIQEGREDLYLLNNETGKKFKFKLEEVK